MNIDTTKYGYIYRITNLVNEKTYIGKHKIKKNERFLDYMGSGTAIRNAIHKYRIENFKKEILAYCENDKSLFETEILCISQEASTGKAEYNIRHGDHSSFSDTVNILSQIDALDLYLDKELSIPDISKLTGLSLPVIHHYLNSFRLTDPRFATISRGKRRKKIEDTPERIEKFRESLAKNKVKCNKCNDFFGAVVIDRHEKACNSLGKPKCLVCGTILTKNTAKYCKLHVMKDVSIKEKLSKNFGDSTKQGGLVASHNRWHVARNIIGEDCSLCQNKS